MIRVGFSSSKIATLKAWKQCRHRYLSGLSPH